LPVPTLARLHLVDEATVRDRLRKIVEDEDLRKYIL
jgi:ATP-dependent protease HslVU (ClpYQ) ATPase subunit